MKSGSFQEAVGPGNTIFLFFFKLPATLRTIPIYSFGISPIFCRHAIKWHQIVERCRSEIRLEKRSNRVRLLHPFADQH